MASRKRVQREVERTAKKVVKKSPVLAIVLVIIFIAVCIGGYFVYNKFIKKQPVPPVGELSFHFLTLGNDNAGDCIYIRAGDNDILIDGGSNTDSMSTIRNHLSGYMTDNTLEYVIITHADKDHIACFGGTNSGNSLFDYYECKTIIDFPMTEKDTQIYNRYVSERADEIATGAKHYTALECYQEVNGAKREYALSESVSMKILYNYFYENDADNENDYSVCLMFTHGDRKFLFTGDLEEEGEEYLVQYNQSDLTQVELFKAGHHGSKTSSNSELLSRIKPKICVVTCVAGTDEYTDTVANQFPTQAFIDRISRYTSKVYVTSLGDPDYTNGQECIDMNGVISVISDVTEVRVECSNNDTLLKDTDWFKGDRTTPSYWAN